MVSRGQVFDSGTAQLEVVVTADDSGGALFELRATYRPASGFPPAHLHPAQDEHFEVLEGQLVFLVDGTEHVVRAGESIDVLRGQVHQVANQAEETAVCRWQTRPALRTGEFHEAVAAARAAGDTDALIRAVTGHSEVFVLA